MLERIRWLLTEAEAWPEGLVDASAREALTSHYRRREAEALAMMSSATLTRAALTQATCGEVRAEGGAPRGAVERDVDVSAPPVAEVAVSVRASPVDEVEPSLPLVSGDALASARQLPECGGDVRATEVRREDGEGDVDALAVDAARMVASPEVELSQALAVGDALASARQLPECGGDVRAAEVRREASEAGVGALAPEAERMSALPIVVGVEDAAWGAPSREGELSLAPTVDDAWTPGEGASRVGHAPAGARSRDGEAAHEADASSALAVERSRAAEADAARAVPVSVGTSADAEGTSPPPALARSASSLEAGAPPVAAADAARIAERNAAGALGRQSGAREVVAPRAALRSAEDVSRARTPRQPSAPPPTPWAQHLKAFFTESVGWFIGAFLILSGTVYFVADAWDGMSSTLRALTVFGGAAGWTLAFAAWARFLSRRPETQPAARGLWRISGVIAPLAAVALGAVDGSVWSWALLLAWSAVAAALARKVAKLSSEASGLWLAASAAVAAVVLGAAPWLVGLRVTPWLTLVPAACAAVAWTRARRMHASVSIFAVVASLWPVALTAVRLHVALGDASVHAVTVALLGLGALALIPREGKLSQGLRVVVVVAQAVSLGVAAVAPAPAFVLTAFVGVLSCLSLVRARLSEASSHWVYPAWAFAYFTFQSLSQLMPPEVQALIARLKAWLGYAVTPLPPSWASVTGAAFVIVVGGLAVWRWRTSRDEASRRDASALLMATAGGVTLFAVLAALSVDVRPMLVAVPALALFGVGVGLWLDRRELTWAGAIATSVLAITLAARLHLPLPVAALAVALAVVALRTKPSHALPATLGSIVTSLAVGTSVFAYGLGGPVAWAALALGALAVTVAVFSVAESAILRGAALLSWLSLAVHLDSPLAMGVLGLGAALLLAVGNGSSRRRAWLPLALVASTVAPLWRLFALAYEPAALGLGATSSEVLLLASAAFWLVARRSPSRTWGPLSECAAAVTLLGALLPRAESLNSPPLTMGVLAGIAALASLRAARAGARSAASVLWALGVMAVAVAVVIDNVSWMEAVHFDFPLRQAVVGVGALALAIPLVLGRVDRRGVLVALGAGVVTALLTVTLGWSGIPAAMCTVALLTTGALLPAVTLPVAALTFLMMVSGLTGMRGTPLPGASLWLSMATTAVMVADKVPWLRRWWLNGARMAWPGVVVAATALLGGTLVYDGGSAMVAAVALPLVWAWVTGWAGVSMMSILAAGLTGLLRMPGHLVTALLPPLLAVVWGRLLPRWRVTREALGLESRRGLFLCAVTGGIVAAEHLVALPSASTAIVLTAWAVALVGFGGPYAVWRVALAAALPFLVPESLTVASAALTAFALLSRYAPAVARKVMGADDIAWVARTSGFLSVAVAVEACVTGQPLAQVALVAAVGVTALLVESAWLLAAALALMGLDLAETQSTDALTLAPWAWASSVGFALLALAQQHLDVSRRLAKPLRALGVESLNTPHAAWLAACGLAVLVLAVERTPLAVVTVALLLVTPSRRQAGVALGLLAAAALWLLPAESAVMALAVGGAVAAWAGRLCSWPATPAWEYAGWTSAATALCLLLLLGVPLGHPAFAVAFAAAAVTAWAALAESRWHDVAWLVTAACLHAVLGSVGVALATGAPKVLILPWWALAVTVLAAVAWGRTKVALPLAVLALAEVLAALGVVPAGHPREGVVTAVVALALAVGLGRIAVLDDEVGPALVAQTALACVAPAVRWLCFGAWPGVADAWLLMVLGTVLGGAAGFLDREARPKVSMLLRAGALFWPVVGLAFAPWADWQSLALLLVAQSAHFAWHARRGPRRVGAVLSALAFNGAVAVAFFGAGVAWPEWVAISVGVSCLALLHVFRDDVSPEAQAVLRGLAMAFIYAATALRPLAFHSVWGLLLCVATCVVGVGIGVLARIRSYVLLGTIFLVTTVSTTLARYGIEQPRVGAIFLSALGVAVVALMVTLSARREAVGRRLDALRRTLKGWDA